MRQTAITVARNSNHRSNDRGHSMITSILYLYIDFFQHCTDFIRIILKKENFNVRIH